MATHREQRRLVHLSAQYRADDAWRPLTICNISTRGLMAKCAAPPCKGMPVEVRHQGFAVTGVVAWSLGERFGLRSQVPIDLRALQEVAREGSVGRRALPRIAVRIAGEFVLQDKAYTVLLTDISQSGARVYMPVPPGAGTSGLLCWGDQERHCAVLWSAPDCVGVEFAELLPDKEVLGAKTTGRRRMGELGEPVWTSPQLPPHLHGPLPADRRRSGRSNLRLDCEVRQGEDPWFGACLENVSREGFRLAWFAGCQVSQPLSLRLPDGTVIEAAISRRDDHMIACTFAAGLDQAVLDRVPVR